MNLKLMLGLGLLLVLVVYWLWSASGRQAVVRPIKTGKVVYAEYGNPLSRANLVGIQPFMLPGNYQSEQSFYAKLDHYFALAEDRNWLSDSTIVILPEYIGTWLVTAGEKQSVYSSSGIQQALTTMVTSNLLSFIRAYFQARGADKVKDTVFRMKATQTAQLYETVFRRLAEKYGVYIVAGW